MAIITSRDCYECQMYNYLAKYESSYIAVIVCWPCVITDLYVLPYYQQENSYLNKDGLSMYMMD